MVLMIKSHPYFPLLMQIFRFGIVGLLAACVHFSLVVLLVENAFLSPLTANIVGFMIAFQVSYWGHKLWTFRSYHLRHREAYPKLIFVQLMNLTANQSLFYVFLSLNLPYPIALCCVLMILPIFTFISSKWWVFRSS
jgi:putative flippase GtrA